MPIQFELEAFLTERTGVENRYVASKAHHQVYDRVSRVGADEYFEKHDGAVCDIDDNAFFFGFSIDFRCVHWVSAH